MPTLQAQKPVAAVSSERQVVAFRLADETYGIDIAQVHTVITPQPITAIPRSPSYVKGVINLRGRIIPIIDMRDRFGLPALTEEGARDARFVIVEADNLSAGLIVDAVSEVLRLSEDSIDPPSQLVTSVEADCVIGIGRMNTTRRHDDPPTNTDRLIILLSVCRTIACNAEGIDALRSIQAAA